MNEESVRNHQELVKHFEVMGDDLVQVQKTCKSPPSKRNSIDLTENEKTGNGNSQDNNNSIMISNLSSKIGKKHALTKYD